MRQAAGSELGNGSLAWMRLRSGRELLLIIAFFLAIVAIVNPFRELLTQDDGWAYARTVKHVVETGEYHLDDWAAASMPSQIYLGVAVARMFGYSLSLLRISTLILYLAGIVAFYQLLRESDVSSSTSCVLTLTLTCSPLILWLGFTFMTDVQFLGWVLIACWIYARGLRVGSTWALFLGSLPAALAVGTRQFGIALPAGLILAEVILGEKKRLRATALLAAVAIPCAVFFWELWFTSQHPTFTQRVRLVEQGLYLRQGVASLLLQTVWRGAVLAEYLGLYLVALTPALLLFVVQERTTSRARLIIPGSLAAAYISVGHVLSATWASGALLTRLKAALVPPIPWVIGFLFPYGSRYQLTRVALGLLGGVLCWALLFRGSVVRLAWRERDMVGGFLVATPVAFGILHLAYVQFNDTYLIVFVPFVLIGIALLLQSKNASAICIRSIGLCSAILGLVMALWMRGDYNKQEAIWNACDEVQAAGIDAMQVRGSLHWVEYNGAFEDWLTQLGPQARPETYAGPYRLHDPFYAWVAKQQQEAEYLVFPATQAPHVVGYDLVRRVRYRDLLFRARFVYIARRRATPPEVNSQGSQVDRIRSQTVSN